MYSAKSTSARAEPLQHLDDDEQSSQAVDSEKHEVVAIVTTITEHGVTYSKDESDIVGHSYQGHMVSLSLSLSLE